MKYFSPLFVPSPFVSSSRSLTFVSLCVFSFFVLFYFCLIPSSPLVSFSPLSPPFGSSLVSLCLLPCLLLLCPSFFPYFSSLFSLCFLFRLLSRLLVSPLSSPCVSYLLLLSPLITFCLLSTFCLLVLPFISFFFLPPSFPFSPLLSPSVSSLSPLFFSFVSSISFCFVSSPRVSFFLLSPFLSPLVSSLLAFCLFSSRFPFCLLPPSLLSSVFFLSPLSSPCVPLFFPFVSSLVSSCVLPPLPLPPLSSFHHLSPPPLLR